MNDDTLSAELRAHMRKLAARGGRAAGVALGAAGRRARASKAGLASWDGVKRKRGPKPVP